MKRNTILSILITTYNRVGFLETTVSLFVSQIINGRFADQVEVIIGNDASSDGTQEYLNQLQAQHSFIKVLNHPKNLGLSGNIEKITAAACGEYIWHFGEDDLIIEGSVKRILDIIHTHDPNYLVINTQNILSLDNRNKEYTIAGENRLQITKDIFIHDFQAEKKMLVPLENWLYLTGLLSAVACKRALFLEWMDRAKRYVQNENVYLYQAPIIMGISQVGKLYIIADPLILHRKNENHWYASVSKILTVNLYDSSEVAEIVKEYMPSEYARYQKRFAAFVLATIISAKKSGTKVTAYIFDALKRNYNCYPYNIRFLIMLILPRAVVKRFF